MNNLKFTLPQKANFEEVVDTLGDIFETAAVIEKQLSDGFQWLQDLIKIADQEDEIRDAIASFPTFLKQFRGLPPEVAVQATVEAETRAIAKVGQLGKVSKFVAGLLRNSASNYQFLKNTIAQAKIELRGWEDMFDGDTPQL